jgi:hypothetical protein
VDAFLASPFAFSTYYMTRNLVEKDLGTPLEGLMEYWEHDFLKVMRPYWCLWVPVQCITFSIVPPQFKIAFVGSVSVLWMVVLSFLTHDEVESDADVGEHKRGLKGVECRGSTKKTPSTSVSESVGENGL